MDKAIFQFHSDSYDGEEVRNFSRNTCERLSVLDEDVTKFDLETYTLEDLLNDEMLDETNCFFRVFLE